MKTITETTTTEVPGYEVIAQADLRRAIDAELAKIGEGPCESWGSGYLISFESLMTAQCSISVRMHLADVICSDYAGFRLHSVEVEISWSCARRSVAQAAVALDDYPRTLGIATFIEALTQGKYIAVAK